MSGALNTSTRVSDRCKWCGSVSSFPGLYACGTVGKHQSVRCQLLVNAEGKDSRRGMKGSPRKSADRVAVENMRAGEVKVFPVKREHSLKLVRWVISKTGSNMMLQLHKTKEGLLACMVPKVDDMVVGETRLYTSSLWLISRFVSRRNAKHLKGKDERAYCFDLVDGHYHLKRIL